MYTNSYNLAAPPSSPSAISFARQKVRNLRNQRIIQQSRSENVDPFADPNSDQPCSLITNTTQLRPTQCPTTSSIISKRSTRSPLAIIIPPNPQGQQQESQLHVFFNTNPSPAISPSPSLVAPSTPLTPRISGTTPKRLQIEPWLASARQRARQGAAVSSAKLVAAKLLARNAPRPLVRLPPPEVPRPYVKSCLSRMVIVES
jgi:hypothetical protein